MISVSSNKPHSVRLKNNESSAAVIYTTDAKNCNITSGSSQWGYTDNTLVNAALQDQPKKGKTHEVIGTRHLHDLERAPDLPNSFSFLVQFFHGPRRTSHFP